MADERARDDLTTRQQDAVIALLSQPTIRKASAACSVPERTLYAWLAEPTFKALYRRARRAAMEQAVSRLQHHAGSAVDVLVAVMLNTRALPATRISAAKTILEMGQQWLTTEDMLQRLEALEQRHDEQR